MADSTMIYGMQSMLESIDKKLDILLQRSGQGGQPHGTEETISGKNYNTDRSCLDNPEAIRLSPDFETEV